MANNDKYFFRSDRLSPQTDLPRGVTWAIEDDGSDSRGGGGGGSSSYVSEITYENSGNVEWQPGNSNDKPELTQCPTPIISGVISQIVAQNSEGIAKTSVYLSVECIDDVEYEVVVTPV